MTYALVMIRFTKPLEQVLPHVDAHRAYLRGLKESGLLLVSGPFEPRIGGGVLLRIPDDQDPKAVLAKVRDDDPFFTVGLADYELLVWKPTIGTESLDQMR